MSQIEKARLDLIGRNIPSVDVSDLIMTAGGRQPDDGEDVVDVVDGDEAVLGLLPPGLGLPLGVLVEVDGRPVLTRGGSTAVVVHHHLPLVLVPVLLLLQVGLLAAPLGPLHLQLFISERVGVIQSGEE